MPLIIHKNETNLHYFSLSPIYTSTAKKKNLIFLMLKCNTILFYCITYVYTVQHVTFYSAINLID